MDDLIFVWFYLLEEKSESRIITWQGIRFIATQVAIPTHHQSMMRLRFNEPLLKTLSTRTEERSFQITKTWRYEEPIIYYSCYYWQKSKKLRCFWNFWTICLMFKNPPKSTISGDPRFFRDGLIPLKTSMGRSLKIFFQKIEGLKFPGFKG